METTKTVFSGKWKDIPGYEGLYQASTLGCIRSYDKEVELHHGGTYTYKGRVLSLADDGTERYLRTRLSKDGKRTTKSVHRLIALTWVPNPDNKPQVNHKDLDKRNNKIENLEWCNQSENTKHAWDNGCFSERGKVSNGIK